MSRGGSVSSVTVDLSNSSDKSDLIQVINYLIPGDRNSTFGVVLRTGSGLGDILCDIVSVA